MKQCKICKANKSIQQTIDNLCKNASFKEASTYAKKNDIMASAIGIEVHYKRHVLNNALPDIVLDNALPDIVLDNALDNDYELNLSDIEKTIGMLIQVAQKEIADYENNPKNPHPQKIIETWDKVEKIYERRLKFTSIQHTENTNLTPIIQSIFDIN